MSLPKYDEERVKHAGKTFTYTDFNSTANTMCVKITDGYFKDVVYHYKRVRINEPTDNIPDPSMTFEYEIDDVPETVVIENLTPELHEEFETLIGDILINIIQEKLDNESRENNSQSSTAQ